MLQATANTASATLTEIKPHSWITTNRFFVSADRRFIVKYHCPKKRRFRAYQYRLLRFVGYPIPFEFRSERARCAHEREIYSHWHALGFEVPRLIAPSPVVLPGPADRCLVLEYIDGEVLSNVLSASETPLERKLALAALLFRRCNKRHTVTFRRRDRRLIKYDGNLRNILVRGNQMFDVDFECGRVLESLERGAAREIGRYAVDTIKMIGSNSAQVIVDLLREEYGHTDVLARLVREGMRKRPQAEFSLGDLARLLART